MHQDLSLSMTTLNPLIFSEQPMNISLNTSLTVLVNRLPMNPIIL